MSAAAHAKSDEPSTITLSGDFVVDGTMEDIPIALIVDAATPDRPLLNPDYVEKAGITKSFIGGKFGIGPVKITANTSVAKFLFEGMKWKQRALWADRAYTAKYDGGVGPGGIPYDVVILNLRTPVAGEQLYAFPLEENGNSIVEMEIGGKTIDISFTQKRTRTLATAAAGAIVAENHDGAFTGESDTTEIAYGVERPIRKLKLNKPIPFIGLSLDSFFVRTKDDGDSSGIVDGDAVVDSSEIVVIGKRGKKDKNRYSITLGRDDLAHCSSITYNKPAKKIQLSCKPL